MAHVPRNRPREWPWAVPAVPCHVLVQQDGEGRARHATNVPQENRVSLGISPRHGALGTVWCCHTQNPAGMSCVPCSDSVGH